MHSAELIKKIRILERKLARCEENRILIEEALESHITALRVGMEELTKSHETIKMSEERFKKLALYDTLTKLPGRILFFEILDRAILHARRGHHTIAILFIDLDNFKRINDTYGHHSGDIVLQEVSTKLLSCVRTIDTVSRLAGDEFVVLLDICNDTTEIETIASRIVSTFKDPVTVLSQALPISASIGISTFPTDGECPHDLLKKADIAMYKCKEHDGSVWQFYAALNTY